MTTVLVWIALFIGWLLSLCFSAAVTVSLWDWFLVPLGVPALQGYAHALGIGLIVAYLTTRIGQTTEKITAGMRLCVWYTWYVLVWTFGFILNNMMA